MEEHSSPPVKRSKRVQFANQRISDSTGVEPSCALEGEKNENTGMAVNEDSASSASSNKITTKRWEAWNILVVNHFYEALKMYGKDFDAITKHMRTKAKGECPKNHHQVRSHFYNTLQKVSSLVNLADVDAPKEVKELFTMINYMEWCKRTNKTLIRNNETMKAHFTQLVLTGSVMVKVKSGKGNKVSKTVIKTPVCRALRRYCQETRDASLRCPSEITIELVPKTYEDKAYVLECHQNPLLRLQLSCNDFISPYFSCIANKWIPPDVRRRQTQLEEDMSEWLPSLKFYAEQHTKLTAVKVFATPNAHNASSAISLNQFVRMKIDVQKSPADKEIETTEDTVDQEYQELSPSLMRDGLTYNNVGSLTAGQLSLMCNCVDTIRLVYEVKSKWTSDTPNSWQCLMTLLLRDYAESMHKATGNPVAPQNVSCSTTQYYSTIEKCPPIGGHAVREENNHFFSQLKHLSRPCRTKAGQDNIVLRQLVSSSPVVVSSTLTATPNVNLPMPPLQHKPLGHTPKGHKPLGHKPLGPNLASPAIISMQVDASANEESVIKSGGIIVTPNGSKISSKSIGSKSTNKKIDHKKTKGKVDSPNPKRQLQFEDPTKGLSQSSFSAYLSSPSKQPSLSGPLPPELNSKMMELMNCDSNDFLANNNLDSLCSTSNLEQPTDNSKLDTPNKLV